MNYAIIQASGKQIWVQPGQFYDLNHIPLHPGDQILLEKVLLVNFNGNIKIGSPCLNNVKIEATILRHLSGDKIRVYKNKPKKQARSTKGYRQTLTRIKIDSIQI